MSLVTSLRLAACLAAGALRYEFDESPDHGYYAPPSYDALWGGAVVLGPWTLHPLVLIYAVSGSAMREKSTGTQSLKNDLNGVDRNP